MRDTQGIFLVSSWQQFLLLLPTESVQNAKIKNKGIIQTWLKLCSSWGMLTICIFIQDKKLAILEKNLKMVDCQKLVVHSIVR